jgi:hypothetical protein
VSTGDVIIAVAAAVVLVALIAAASIRGRGMRAAQRRREIRQDLDQALERADQAGRERDAALGLTEPEGGVDEPVALAADADPPAAGESGGFWHRRTQ